MRGEENIAEDFAATPGGSSVCEFPAPADRVLPFSYSSVRFRISYSTVFATSVSPHTARHIYSYAEKSKALCLTPAVSG